jgi:hypothetical protein
MYLYLYRINISLLDSYVNKKDTDISQKLSEIEKLM